MTFLFTDIEGSTRRWESDADAMRAALVAHDEVLRTAIDAHEGFLFSHTGDGVVAAFASPKAAVDARSLRSGRWNCRCGWGWRLGRPSCFALLAHGGAHVDSDPLAAYDSYRRALTVARESGNRQLESAVAVMLCVLVTNQGEPMFAETAGDPIDTFDYLTVTIRRYHDAGSVSLLRNPLAILAAVFDRLGRHEEAAIISGFAANAMTRASFPQLEKAIAHLRDMLGDQTSASLASKGERWRPRR